ncbi:MAG: AMP-binding protein, partial [Actinomycetota bacterium]
RRGLLRLSEPVERLTAAEAEDRQRRAAGGLAALGLGEGDRVGVLAPSGTGLLVAVLGALRSGVVPVVVDPSLTADERRVVLDDAEVAVLLDEASLAGLEDGATPRELAPWPRARPMHYTSGTTGRPKGVWSGLLSDDDAAALQREEQELWGFGPADDHVVCSPLHHSAPIRFAAGTLAAGGTVTVLGRFSPARFRAAVRSAEGPVTAFTVPTHLQRLLAADLPDLSGFRLLAHAGAPCPESLKRAVIERFPPGSVWEFYGSTEGQFTACPSAEWEEHPGTVGRARPGRSLSVDPNGTIWCAVPEHARFRYWRDEAATASAWRGDRFTVGDLGRLDEAGYLYLDGRREDLVITGGVNVYPAEVESVLSDCPGVGEIAVFGVDDDQWGQRVCAAVVGEVTDHELGAYATEHLAPPKRPKQVVRVDELPRTATGKIVRRALSEGAAGGRDGVGQAKSST